MSSVLADGIPTGAGATGGGAQARTALAPPGSKPPQAPPVDGAAQRNNTLTVIAGVGVLLLAMGVGVLIGRSGSSGRSDAPAQVISVASTPAAATATTGAAEASFSSDWPSGTSGYTVQLQTLPAGSTVAAIEAAKSAAGAKGAKSVGALKAEEFASLSGGGYVIYSGVEHKRAQAESSLSALRKSFPAAKVIAVSNNAGGGSAGAGASSGAVGSSESHPAPPSVLNTLKSAKGKSYEEKSKALPDVVETG